MKLLTKIILIAIIACATRGLASSVKPTPKTVYGSWDTISATSVPKGVSLSVVGWGADSAATPTATTGVVAKIFVDGVFLLQVPVSDSRPDVTDYYGFKDCGFTATISTSTLTLGEHTLEIRVGGGPSGWNNYTKTVSSKGIFTVTDPKPAAPIKPSAPPAKTSSAK